MSPAGVARVWPAMAALALTVVVPSQAAGAEPRYGVHGFVLQPGGNWTF